MLVLAAVLGGCRTGSDLDPAGRAATSTTAAESDVEALVARLRSRDTAAADAVIDDLVDRGRAAVGPVSDVLADGPAHSRADAAFVLGSIGDRAAADALWRAIDDPDGEVRGRAATSLSWLDDPRAVDALVRTLEDAQDVLHAFHTLAGVELVDHGPAVVPRLVAELDRRGAYGQMVILTTLGRIAEAARSGDAAMASLAGILAAFDPADSGEGRLVMVARVQAWARRPP